MLTKTYSLKQLIDSYSLLFVFLSFAFLSFLLSWLSSEKLKLKSLSDWYDIPASQVNGSLLQKYKGLANLLSKFYPQHNWNWENNNAINSNNNSNNKDIKVKAYSHRITKGEVSKFQLYLFKMIQRDLFPSCSDIRLNYTHPQLTYEGTQRNMQVIYRPLRFRLHL